MFYLTAGRRRRDEFGVWAIQQVLSDNIQLYRPGYFPSDAYIPSGVIRNTRLGQFTYIAHNGPQLDPARELHVGLEQELVFGIVALGAAFIPVIAAGLDGQVLS